MCGVVIWPPGTKFVTIYNSYCLFLCYVLLFVAVTVVDVVVVVDSDLILSYYLVRLIEFIYMHGCKM